MAELSDFAAERVRPLLRVRQVRDFADRPVARSELDAIADVARWSGSSTNGQPWRFIVISTKETVRRLGGLAPAQTRPLQTATAAIAIVLPEAGHAIANAYDEGRAAERIMIAATYLGLGAGIAWILAERKDANDAVREILGIPPDHFVRSIIAIGHPTEAARAPKNAPGKARLPRQEVVFEERWPKA
jgi:nitroreductase